MVMWICVQFRSSTFFFSSFSFRNFLDNNHRIYVNNVCGIVRHYKVLWFSFTNRNETKKKEKLRTNSKHLSKMVQFAVKAISISEKKKILRTCFRMFMGSNNSDTKDICEKFSTLKVKYKKIKKKKFVEK